MSEDIDWNAPQELVAFSDDASSLAESLRQRFPGMTVVTRDGGVFALFPLELIFDLEDFLKNESAEAWDYCTPDLRDFTN